MKLIEQCVTILPIDLDTDIQEVHRFIEEVGRVCYKSEDKITEDSYKGFINRIINSGHLSVLEHGTIYLGIRSSELTIRRPDLETLLSSPYTFYKTFDNTMYITTNYRVLVENNWLDDLQYLCEPTEYHTKRITSKFICDRGVSHEFVRHRVFSFAQESTRQETMAA